MIYKVKRYILMLILAVFSILAFADTPEAPNTLITENPDKPVTTIDAPKNREHAEMNITVNKINPQEIEGDILGDSKTKYLLPKEERSQENIKEKIVVVEDIGEFEKYNSKLRRRSVNPDEITYELKDNVLMVNTVKPVYIGVLENGKLGRVYRGSISGYVSAPNYTFNLNHFTDRLFMERIDISEATTVYGLGEHQLKSMGELSTKVRSVQREGGDIERTLRLRYDLTLEKLNGVGYPGSLTLNTSEGPYTYSSGRFTTSRVLYANTSEKGFKWLGSNIWFENLSLPIGEYYVEGGFGITGRVYVPQPYAGMVEQNGPLRADAGNKRFYIGRYNKSYTVTPREENIGNTGELTESQSIVTNSNGNTTLPTDWIGRADETTTDDTKGLQLYVASITGYTMTKESNNKRIWNITNTNTGLNLKVWLEKIGGSNQFKYKVNAWPKEKSVIPINVRHKINGKTLFDDTIKLEIPLVKNLIPVVVDVDLTNSFIDEIFTLKNLENFELKYGDEISIKNSTKITVNDLVVGGYQVNGVEIGASKEEGRLYFYFKRKRGGIEDGEYDIKVYRNGEYIYYLKGKLKNTWYSNTVETVVTLNEPLYSKIALVEGRSLERGEEIGKVYNVGSNSGTFWAIADRNFTNRLKFSGDSPSKTSDDNVSLTSKWIGPTFTKQGATSEEDTRVELSFNGDGKAYLEIKEWNYKAQDINIEYEGIHFKQKIILKLTNLDGRRYIDKSVVSEGIDYSGMSFTKTLDEFIRGELGSFNVKLDDYSVKILGMRDGASNFAVRIPHSITLIASTADGKSVDIPVSVEVMDESNNSKIVNENYYYYISPTGVTSNMNIKVTLTADFISPYSQTLAYNIVNLEGRNTGLVEIGAKRPKKFHYQTAINDVRMTVRYPTYEENIEYIDEEIGAIKDSENLFPGIDETSMLVVNGNFMSGANLIRKGQIIDNSGIRIQYDKAKQKFVFKKEESKGYSGRIDISTHIGNDSSNPIMRKITYNLKNTKSSSVTVNLSNPIVGARENSFYGAMTILSSESMSSANYLDANGSPISFSVKGGQFDLSGKVTGKASAFETTDKVIIRYNGKIQEINTIASDDIIPVTYLQENGVKLGVDYQRRNGKVEGLDIYLYDWDLRAKNITFSVAYNQIVNKYTINIPSYDGNVYFNDTSDKIDLARKIIEDIKGELLIEGVGKVITEVPIGIKDYDLEIFKDTSGKVQQHFTIPKKLTMNVNGNGGTLILETQLINKNGQIESDDTNWYVYPKGTNGIGSSEALAEKLQIKVSADNTLRRETVLPPTTSVNLNYKDSSKPVIALDVNKANRTIIAEEYNVVGSNQNYSESFDMRSENKGAIKEGVNLIPIFDDDVIEIYKDGTMLTKISGSKLILGWPIEESGLELGYDEEKQKLKVTKKEGAKFEAKYRIKIKSYNILLRELDLEVKNRLGFEIIGNSKLDFGDFFAGETKFAESIIKFRNNEKAKISIELKSTTGEMTLNGIPTSDPNRKVKLSDFKVWDLNQKNPDESSFRMRGRADSTSNTEVGEYKGLMEVIFTILPN